MKIIETEIPEVKIIEPYVYEDNRGVFIEVWNEKKFNNNVCERTFVQDNYSKSCKNTLRGLHYQTENTQGKLVRVIRGKVYDVAVDLREKSKTFCKWVGVELSEKNKRQLWIPEGFAHGFLVMSDIAEFEYKCTDFYNPAFEKTIIWNDPLLNIKWPIENMTDLILSAKDINGEKIKEATIFKNEIFDFCQFKK